MTFLRAISILRRKVVWFGGWETRQGLDMRQSPYPLIVLSTLTFFSWGWELKLFGQYMVCRKRSKQLYISRDGSRKAARWILGRP